MRQQAVALVLAMAAISVYNGYFGAGSGVMMLAAMTWLVDAAVARANALKNVIVGIGAVASATTFIALGHVDWSAAVPLAIGMFVGSTFGPVLARHLPGGAIRGFAALAGIGLAIRLWVAPLT